MAINIQKPHQQSGFTIVELMVGLVIGLIATLVIVQTFSAFEGNKRSTTGTSDAQTNGSIGLYMVQRELQFAGYGIPMVSGTMPQVTTLPYNVTYQDNSALTQAQIDADALAKMAAYNARIAVDSATVTAGKVFSALKCTFSPDTSVDADNLAATPDILSSKVVTPVTIVDGASGASDSISIRYGDTTRGALHTNISVTPATPPAIIVGNNLGCQPNDLVLISGNSNYPDYDTACYVTRVTSTTAQLATANEIRLASLTGINSAKPQRLACLGKVKEITFDVSANQLRKTNLSTGTLEPVLSEIVSLQAQYGVSVTANSEIVNSWQDASGASWANPTLANRNLIKAVRIAIVARNNLLEKTIVSQACNGSTTGIAAVCAFGGNVTFANADWANYRYRVYEVVVPLKNMLAATPQL